MNKLHQQMLHAAIDCGGEEAKGGKWGHHHEYALPSRIIMIGFTSQMGMSKVSNR
jgi:hypothetical protein